jgi:hypothetical protein
MELIVEKQTIQVAPAVKGSPLLAEDKAPMVRAPLTNGFTRTSYEQQQAEAEAVAAGRPE